MMVLYDIPMGLSSIDSTVSVAAVPVDFYSCILFAVCLVVGALAALAFIRGTKL